MEKNHSEKALEYFKSGCGCAQAVILAFSDVTGLDEDTALRIGSSLGGGVGRMREVCGACTGMAIVAGLLYGSFDVNDNKAKSEHYALIQDMANRFKAQHKTIICRELLKNMADSTPNATPRTKEFYKVRPCAAFVVTAAEILDEIIEEKRNQNAF